MIIFSLYLRPFIQTNNFTDSSGCFAVNTGKAEIIPVEPGQGNACAGKVVLSFTPTLHFRSISFKSIFTSLFTLCRREPFKLMEHEKIVFGDLLFNDFPNCYFPANKRESNRCRHRHRNSSGNSSARNKHRDAHKRLRVF